MALFLFALAVRCIYVLSIYAFMGDAGLMGADSVGYLALGHGFAEAVRQSSVHGFHWLGPSPAQMPLFTWLLAIHVALWDAHAALGFVMTQTTLDAGTCVLVFLIARSLSERFAVPAGILAALNPTQIVIAGMVYSDTAFLFLMTLSFYSAISWYERPTARHAVWTGIILGIAGLVRVTAFTWLPVLIGAFILHAWRRGQLNARMLWRLSLIATIAAMFALPVVARNIVLFEAYSLTPQGGEHLARHVVPFVQEVADGTPRAPTVVEIDRRRQDRFGDMPVNYFEQSRQYTQLGIEELARLGGYAVVKAWLLGTVLNIATPAAILSPPVAQLPRTGFFYTEGPSMVEKVRNFLFRSDNASYAIVLFLGIVGVAAVRLLQLGGLIQALPLLIRWPPTLMFAVWIGYILAISGPIASPKYRLPIEPPLMILAGAGLSGISRRFDRGSTNFKTS